MPGRADRTIHRCASFLRIIKALQRHARPAREFDLLHALLQAQVYLCHWRWLRRDQLPALLRYQRTGVGNRRCLPRPTATFAPAERGQGTSGCGSISMGSTIRSSISSASSSTTSWGVHRSVRPIRRSMGWCRGCHRAPRHCPGPDQQDGGAVRDRPLYIVVEKFWRHETLQKTGRSTVPVADFLRLLNGLFVDASSGGSGRVSTATGRRICVPLSMWSTAQIPDHADVARQ